MVFCCALHCDRVVCPVTQVSQRVHVPFDAVLHPLFHLPAAHTGQAVHTLSAVVLHAVAYCPTGHVNVEHCMQVLLKRVVPSHGIRKKPISHFL